MDGMHDLGGRQGFGPVRYTVNARAFHAPWEVRVNSLYDSVAWDGVKWPPPFPMPVTAFSLPA